MWAVPSHVLESWTKGKGESERAPEFISLGVLPADMIDQPPHVPASMASPR